jgi:dipeptidyl-peptidase-4
MFFSAVRFPAIAALLAVVSIATAQTTLEHMPRYDRYERLRREISSSVSGGAISVTWDDDGVGLTYLKEDKNYRLDVDSLKEQAVGNFAASPRTRRQGQRGTPERGRQFDTATSPDGKLRAVSRERNVVIENVVNPPSPVKVTIDGSVEHRVKYGIASWVYGEELGVKDAMWWSPDSTKLAFYRFDETEVKDYFLGYNQTAVQDALNQEAYPKAGAPNPKVSLLVYDVVAKTTTSVHVDFGDPTLAEYVYDVKWSPDGKLLLFNRTNRKQNHMQLCAADPATGAAHPVVDELQPQSWAENHPEVYFLKDNQRFIWSSERDGFKNFYLYNLDGRLLSTVTSNKFDAMKILFVDEDRNEIFYSGFGTKMPYHRQVYKDRLDGTSHHLLTDPDLDHVVNMAPQGAHFVDISSSNEHPPQTTVVDREGKVVFEIAKSDTKKFEALKLRKTEVFTFPSADKSTTLYGTLQFPSDFDSKKKYPVLLNVYGGPESAGIPGSFLTPNPITELGFLVVNLAGRGTTGRGKAFRDAVYEHLGIVEIDDQAAGVSSLASRRYVDMKRVGVFGTSYGGYSTLMCLLRHPEIFKVGCSSSPVTDWKNYDSIYTERYNGLPDDGDNKKGYQMGSAMTYVKNLTGWLMLYFGTADNNVHPSNTIQLVQAIEDAGKRYDLQVGPDRGHSQMNATRMWEYFVQHLILDLTDGDPLKAVFLRRQRERKRNVAVALPDGGRADVN